MARSAPLAAALACAALSAAAPVGAQPTVRYAALAPVTFHGNNASEYLALRLYRDDGTLDPAAMRGLAHLLRDTSTGEDSPLVPRTARLLVRIATHFAAERVNIVSGYRSRTGARGRAARREGYHGEGSAVDFALPGVAMDEVAAYARTLAHVGVGYYPESNFVHLDSRDRSYFWVNAAGARREGWNHPLERGDVAARDAAWTPDDDAPWDPPGTVRPPDLHPGTAPEATHHQRLAARHGRRHHGDRGTRLRVFQGE